MQLLAFVGFLHVACADISSKPVDLVLLVDGSKSIRRADFEKLKAYLGGTIGALNFQRGNPDNGTILSMVQFSDDPEIVIQTSDYATESLSALATMKQMRKNTALNTALKFVHRTLFTPETTRKNSIKVLVVITDGRSQQRLKYAKTLHSDGILTVAIGVGHDVSRPQLANLASDPSYVALSPSYEQLNKTREHINAKFSTNRPVIPEIAQICVEEAPSAEVSECFGRTVDLIFLVDGSNSIPKAAFEHLRGFLGDTINQLKELKRGRTGTVMSLVQFSTSQEVVRNMRFGDSKRGLLRGLKKMKQMKAGTKLNAALKYVDRVVIGSQLMRSHATPVLVVITDGHSEDGVEHAKILHAKKVYTIAVGVGEETDMDQLEALASDPALVYKQANFAALHHHQAQLSKKVCTVIKNKAPKCKPVTTA